MDLQAHDLSTPQHSMEHSSPTLMAGGWRPVITLSHEGQRGGTPLFSLGTRGTLSDIHATCKAAERNLHLGIRVCPSYLNQGEELLPCQLKCSPHILPASWAASVDRCYFLRCLWM